MEMPVQIALFIACVAVTVFVIGCLLGIVQVRRSLGDATKSLDEMKADLKLLVQDTRKLVKNVDDLTERAHRQWDDVEHVLGTVRGWSERANRIVNEVGSAIEPPLLTAARSIGIFRTGLAAFLQALGNRKPKNEQKDEE